MTAALLVLEPIFEADLPSEIYAYRAARNAQQARAESQWIIAAPAASASGLML
jgi:hypothetical protein